MTSNSGLLARDAAVSSIYSVLIEKRPFDEAFTSALATRDLSGRDRAFARAVATEALRYRGALRSVVNSFIEKPLPENFGRLDAILLSAAAQLLILKTPPHAAISLAVDQCREDKTSQRFDKLVNAVLRRVSELGHERFAQLNVVEAVFPDWLLARWRVTYGDVQAKEIAEASLSEPALDLTVKSETQQWAERLGGILLPTGSVRLAEAGRIEEIEGYDAGAWWVQDAAAALPARLFGKLDGLRVADLCAAPGGKTAQLAAAGARVTAVDKSPGRLKRLTQNLARLGLTSDMVTADACDYAPGELFDCVLVDAPCTATGTIRRHPDILHLKRAEDVVALQALQARLLANASRMVKTGGTLVYCTCSLEAEECEHQIAAFLESNAEFRRRKITPEEVGDCAELISGDGDLRTLPSHFASLPKGMRGLDGFYAARLVRSAGDR